MRKGLVLAVMLALAWTVSGNAAEEGRLLRFPDIHGDQIVFSYGCDLWTVPTSGGLARKLTNSDGIEIFPRFSRDGKQIAFTGQYEGDWSVYVMPTDGGMPKRLTYHPGIQRIAERMGPEDVVMDWTRDNRILYRSREEKQDAWEGRLYLVSPNGGYRQPLPLPRGGFASFNADGTKLAYCPICRDFRTWKRYKGGAAQDVWIYDFDQKKSERITDWEGTDNVPMWDEQSGLIFFNSDRTGTLNLFSYDPATKETKQVTSFTDYDVRWPAMGPGAIVFENGGYIYVLDLPNGTPRKVDVQLGSDKLLARPRFVDCSKSVQDFTLSPDGNRAIFDAHGEIFTVPNKHGNTRNLSNTPGANEKYATISPDGQWIAYVSDASGEDEIYMIKPGGNGTARRLTTDGWCYKYQILWSPDSKKIVWSNKTAQVRYVDIDTKAVTNVDKSEKGDIRDYQWSPDSRYISYSKNNDNSISMVWIYSLADGQKRTVTNGAQDDFGATFDPTGKYLYFLSNRFYNPILGNYEFNYVLDKSTEIIATVLKAGDPSPFAPESDEIGKTSGEEENGDKGKDKDKKKGKAAGPTVTIDWTGIVGRQVRLPIDAGSYRGLSAVEGRLFYMSFPLGGMAGPLEDAKTSLHVFDFKDRKDNTFLEGLNGYELTPDGKKMIVGARGSYEIINTSGDKGTLGENTLNLSDMKTYDNFYAEWHQIFEESWRLERDFFYDSLMHGLDWQKIHDRYAPLVDHVAHRFDLTYVIGEMIGELACSHTYVGGGDMPDRQTNQVGLLGINWAIDSAGNRYRIGRILYGQDWVDSRVSPLREPGIKASEGDYVIAIDGQPMTLFDNPYQMLDHKAGKQVTLTLAKTPAPAAGASWDVTVKTISDESDLRYFDWIERNRMYVDSVSNGRIGYVHIPDMGGGGLREFSRQFFPQIRKEGMVIDVRYNGGGFVSQLIIERLRRVLGGMGISRNFHEPSTYPSTVFNGYLVCLINEHSCSDGDIFPHYFRQYGLGPLIGMRTWGGVVGIRGHRPMVDGGFITTPEFAKYDFNSDWSAMENYGVPPDIEVDNLPEDVMRGVDAQLNRALDELNKEIQTAPKQIPPPPSTPPHKR